MYYDLDTYVTSDLWYRHLLTGFLMVFNYYSWYCVNANQLPTPPFYYMHECQDSLIQCLTRFIVSIPISWIFSWKLWTTETAQHTSAQSISTFSALILAGDSETGWARFIAERDRELVPHICSYDMIKYWLRLDVDCHMII